MITPDQIRAARALKNWSQTELAERVGMAVPSIANIELGKQKPSAATLERIIAAFSLAGISFTEGEGVRKSHGEVTILEGAEGFREFLDDLVTTAGTIGGDIYLFNRTSENWKSILGEEWYWDYAKRMDKVKENYDYKIMVNKEDWDFRDFAEYAYIPTESFGNNSSLYVYGDKIAFMDFAERGNPRILVLKQNEFAATYKALFKLAWNNQEIISEKK